MDNEFEIVKYTEDREKEWDDFIANQSLNGTFLQSRNFLNYHPQERFVDASYMIYDTKKHLVAVCPACEKYENGLKTLYSHSGSTYGGIIISHAIFKTVKLVDMVKQLEAIWITDGYEGVVLKQTPDLFCRDTMSSLQYVLYYLGYQEEKELNLYIDLEKCSDDILQDFSHGKRENIRNCFKHNLSCRPLTSIQEIAEFHHLLEVTLIKYGKKPVHTVEELFDFQEYRLHDKCQLFGMFSEDNQMLAGAMMFYFNNLRIAHSQYLCADPDYNALSPMSFAYYSMIAEMKKRNYRILSWGISTDQGGRYLNVGLTTNKESFGSKCSINSTYIKKLTVE